MIKKIVQDRILLVSVFILIICSIIRLPSLSSIDTSTILSLFSLMLIVRVLESSHVLDNIAIYMVSRSHNQRQLVQLLLLISVISAMFVTNDVAIITLVPIVAKVSRQTKMKSYLPITLLTISANLGSSISPIGNPQNIYLLTSNHLSIFQFFNLSLPFGVICCLLLFLATFIFKKETIVSSAEEYYSLDKSLLIKTLIMFVIILMGIFSFTPLIVVSILTVIFVFFIGCQEEFKQIDYALLLTFCCFFLIVGSLNQLPIISEWLTSMTKTDTSVYLTSIAVSQIISNVPAVILLSNYTQQILPLFLGVSVGGLGTLVASLANLLAYKQYLIFFESKGTTFLLVFSTMNIIFLLILGTLCYFLI